MKSLKLINLIESLKTVDVYIGFVNSKSNSMGVAFGIVKSV